MEKFAVVYDRPSSKKQKDNWSRDDAEANGKRLSELHGFTRWEYRLEVKSGEELLNRPIMNALLEQIQAGEVQGIIVQNFERLSRDEDSIDGLIIRQVCRDAGCVVMTPEQVFDFRLDADDKLADILFMIGKWGKKSIITFTLQGMRAKAAAGGYMGGPRAFGYKKIYIPIPHSDDQYTDLAIDEDYHFANGKSWRDFFTLVFDVYNRLSAREGVEQIKRQGYTKPDGGEWLRKDLRRIVKNPIYAGLIAWGRCDDTKRSKHLKDYEVQFVPRPELQFVPIEVWEQANKVRKQKAAKMKARGKWAKHPFSGLLACPLCGGVMYAATTNDHRGGKVTQRIKYYCYNSSQFASKCKGKRFQDNTVNGAMIPFLAGVIRDSLGLGDALNEAAALHGKTNIEATLEQEIRAKLAGVKTKIKNLVDAIADGTLSKDDARDKMTELKDSQGRLERELLTIHEKEGIQAEYLAAMSILQSTDVEHRLWQFLENYPNVIQRLARMIIKPESVVIVTEGKSKATKSRVEKYEFTPEFIENCGVFCTRWGGSEPQPSAASGRRQPAPAASRND
jgi:DNA invertase Pin-like site-specific DNA recombinase